jgi:hypothetical protein
VPDIDLGTRDRLAVGVTEGGVNEQSGSRRLRTDDGVTVFHPRRIHAPERSELAGVGLGLAMVAIVEQADQSRKAERPRHQHRFVVVLVGVLAERDDVADRGLELLLGQLHLTGEIMQMADEGGHDLAKARVRRAGKLVQHRLRDILLAVDDHVARLERLDLP